MSVILVVIGVMSCQDSPVAVEIPHLPDPDDFEPVSAVLTTSILAPPQSSARGIRPVEKPGSTAIDGFAMNRLLIFMSEIQPDGWMSRAWVYNQPYTERGAVPVVFVEEAQSLTDFDTSDLRPKLDMIYIESSAHLVRYNGDWYGKAYGVDHTYYPADSRGQGTHGFYLHDESYYVCPKTGQRIEVREYNIVFVNREILGFSDESFVLHYTKTEAGGDGGVDDEVWEYGSLTNLDDERLGIVEWIMEHAPFRFERAHASTTRDVYFLYVPMEPIVLSSDHTTRITLQVDTSSLVSQVNPEAEPPEVEYALDADNAPISFRVLFEEIDLEE